MSIPKSRLAYVQHQKRLEKYLKLIKEVIKRNAKDIALSVAVSNLDPTKPFSFKNNPLLRRQVMEIVNRFVRETTATITLGMMSEWQEMNSFKTKFAKAVLSKYGVKDVMRYGKYFKDNEDALSAFTARRINGMNLSQRIWKEGYEYQTALEDAIGCSIYKGISAVRLARRLERYMTDHDKLEKDYEAKFDEKPKSQNVSYEAMRLARTEINMAYRYADYLSNQQLDFVLGFEVKRSGGLDRERTGDESWVYDCEVCESLKGRYPKDFIFTGWHPNCRCYTIPILMTEDEFFSTEPVNPKNKVTDVPDGFKRWVVDNEERIRKAEERGKLPYFLQENRQVFENILSA